MTLYLVTAAVSRTTSNDVWLWMKGLSPLPLEFFPICLKVGLEVPVGDSFVNILTLVMSFFCQGLVVKPSQDDCYQERHTGAQILKPVFCEETFKLIVGHKSLNGLRWNPASNQ